MSVEKLIEEAANAHKSNVSRMDELEARMNRMGLNGPPPKDSDPRAEARQFFAMVNGKPLERVTDEQVERFKAYNNAWAIYERLGGAAPPEIRNTLSVGSNPDGGYWVSPSRAGRIVQRIFETSPIRQVASAITIVAGDALTGINDLEEASAGWVAELESRSETDGGNFGEWNIPVSEMYAQPVVTQKLLDDVGIDFGAYIEAKIARKFARVESTAFVSGNGIGRPRGFMDYASTAVLTDDATRAWGKLQYVKSGASAGFPKVSGSNADDPGALYDIISKLKADYRANAVWMMNRATANVIRKLKDADGRFLWRDGLEAGQPDRLLGYPVIEAEDMPDIAADSFSVAFGDFGAGYQIVDKFGIRMLHDPFTTKGRVKFYGTRRVGGNVIGFDAIKLLKMAA